MARKFIQIAINSIYFVQVKRLFMHKSLVRLFLTASLMLASAGSAWAIKANPRPVAVRLPDGSTLTVRIHGDENFNY